MSRRAELEAMLDAAEHAADEARVREAVLRRLLQMALKALPEGEVEAHIWAELQALGLDASPCPESYRSGPNHSKARDGACEVCGGTETVLGAIRNQALTTWKEGDGAEQGES